VQRKNGPARWTRASSAKRLKIDVHDQRTPQLFLKTQEEFGSFDNYIWRFVDGKPKQNAWKAHKQVHPARTLEIRRDEQRICKKRGFPLRRLPQSATR
jgi:DNA-3-methyladenine glycosylase I